jgi:HEAT repeat protein
MKKILFLSIAAAAMAIPAAAQRNRPHSGGAAGVLALPAEDPADSLYRIGRQLVTNREYKRAASVFKQIVDDYPKADHAGDALYWRAWSLYQIGRDSKSRGDLDEAYASIERYNNNYGKSSKAAYDATELTTSIRSAQAQLGDAGAASAIASAAGGLRQQKGCGGSQADEETRMAALDGLLAMNSEDAIPILKDVLKQRDPCRVDARKKALFLISQKRGNDVAATLLDVARSDPSTDVRGEAIFWLSQTRSELAIPALDSVLFQSTDEEIRKKAIFALSQQSRDERARNALKRAAEDTKFPEDLREEAVFWLGQSRIVDLDFFKSLFKKTNSVDLQKKITFTVSQQNSPEAAAWLLDMAKDKTLDVDTRKDAIFWLSQRRQIDIAELRGIYEAARNEPEVQKQVIFVYSQRREAAAVDQLMEIAKSDPKIENRKDALFWLGQKNDPRVKQFIRDLLRG